MSAILVPHIINKVLQLVAKGPWQGLQVTTAAIWTVCLHPPDDAHEKAILVVDATEISL